MIDQTNNSIQIFSTGGSGFVIQKIDHLDITLTNSSPSEGAVILLRRPPCLETTVWKRLENLLNIRNRDTNCFAYSVIAALFPENKHRERQIKYKSNLQKPNFDNIELSMSLTNVPKFEKQNNIGINVFGFDKNKILPIYLSLIKTDTVISLLWLTDGMVSHYCLITNFHAFMAR